VNKFLYCLEKLAEDGKGPGFFKGYALPAAKVIGSGLAGLGAGYAVGAGLGKGIEHVVGRVGGNPADAARKIAPVAGTALGVLYPMWKAREQQEILNAIQRARDQADGGIPGQ
jgi:hypothetical protein